MSTQSPLPSTHEGNFTQNEEWQNNLDGIDILVVVLYVLGTLFLGIWVSRKNVSGSVSDYFLAGRSVTWLPVGASLFASNIGTGHFIGLAGSGASSGIAVGAFEWLAPFSLLMLGWYFLPVYLSCKVYTMPEYLGRRFGGTRLRIMLSVISLMLYVLTKIAVDLYAGALFIQQAFNINMYLAIISLLLITAIYTALGGLKAVIYTDTMQSAVMLVGGLLLTVISFVRIGGYAALEETYMAAMSQHTRLLVQSGNFTTCGIPRKDSFHIFRDPVTADMPWPGMLLGIYLLGSWYWCTDQVIVQRALAAKELNQAKGGCVVAGFLKIIPMYMIVMTGMISRVLFPDEVACTESEECEKICGNAAGCSNIAYPKLVLQILPKGLRGIMIAAMLSALMSSLTSIFNSSSTIFTMDIWKKLRQTASERELLIVGKATVVALVLVSIAWIPVLLSSAGGQLFVYLQSIQSALGPPIFALYCFAAFWPRVNEQGAFWGLVGGFAVGAVRLVLDFSMAPPSCGEQDTRPPMISKVNYLHVAPIVFCISCIITLAISYSTEAPSPERLNGATWFTRDKRQVGRQKEENLELKAEKDEEDVLDVEIDDAANEGRKRFVLNATAIALMVAASFLMGYYG